jgi:8-oxo-dGTP pyrophosphatase MutT (NUDIX family)
MDRISLVQFFEHYKPIDPEEEVFVPQFLDLLTQAPCFERNHLPGHITGSAWIVNPERTQSLLVHHAKLNKWVQPGGHADGDENILGVALREAEEETGLKNLTIVTRAPFDVDIHVIPKRPDFPEHFHYDIRFLFEASLEETILVNEESHAVTWIPLHALENFTRERSVLRMRDKLLRTDQH